MADVNDDDDLLRSEIRSADLLTELKSRWKGEIAQSISALRYEYHVSIPEQLAQYPSDEVVKRLQTRLVHIEKLLTRGYHVGVEKG